MSIVSPLTCIEVCKAYAFQAGSRAVLCRAMPSCTWAFCGDLLPPIYGADSLISAHALCSFVCATMDCLMRSSRAR
jgi:hypothetical protein